MKNEFGPEVKWLIMKCETQKMNGLFGSPCSKHITDITEHFRSTFTADVNKG